jgi:hypothetical protein
MLKFSSYCDQEVSSETEFSEWVGETDSIKTYYYNTYTLEEEQSTAVMNIASETPACHV